MTGPPGKSLWSFSSMAVLEIVAILMCPRQELRVLQLLYLSQSLIHPLLYGVKSY